MCRKPARLLALMVVVGVLGMTLLSAQRDRWAAASGEANTAYVPLIFHDYPPKQYFDDFSDPTRNWYVGSDEVLEIGHVGGEYRIRVKAETTLVSVISPAEFGVTAYHLGVDVRRVDGSDIAYGLVMDWLNWDEYAVLLVVPTLDRFVLYRVQDGEAEELIPWEFTNRLADGLNHVSVKRWESYLTLYINGRQEGEAIDLGYINERPTRTGLAVLAVGTAETTGGFDNFLLVELPEVGAAESQVPPIEGLWHQAERVEWWLR